MHCISTIIMVMITRIIVPYNMNLLHVPKQWIKSTVYRIYFVRKSEIKCKIKTTNFIRMTRRKSRQCALIIFVRKLRLNYKHRIILPFLMNWENWSREEGWGLWKFVIGLKVIYTKYSKQFKWNSYFYVSGQSRPFWAALKLL